MRRVFLLLLSSSSLLLFWWDYMLLCSSLGWPQIHVPPASASQALGLQVYTIIPVLVISFKIHLILGSCKHLYHLVSSVGLCRVCVCEYSTGDWTQGLGIDLYPQYFLRQDLAKLLCQAQTCNHLVSAF